jgi:hypothetical protein
MKGSTVAPVASPNAGKNQGEDKEPAIPQSPT